MGQSVPTRVESLRGSNKFHSSPGQVESVRGEEDHLQDALRKSTASSSSATSRDSVLHALANDQHLHDRLLQETPLILGFTSIAGLLCDITVHLDANYCIGYANSSINSFFRWPGLEGTSFLDIVSQGDRSRVERALTDVSLSCPVLLPAVLVCEEGIGTMTSKLLVMGAILDGNPIYTVGVRTDNCHGLCASYTSEHSPGQFGSFYGSDVMPFGSSTGSCGATLSVLPGGFMSGGPSRDTSFHHSANPLSRDQSLHSHDMSLPSHGSFTYSASSASSSFKNFLGRLPMPKRSTNKTSTTNSTIISQLSAFSDASRRSPTKRKLEDAAIQTDLGLEDVGTQTDSTHIPRTDSNTPTDQPRMSRRPPAKPRLSPRTSPRGSNVSSGSIKKSNSGRSNGSGGVSFRANSDSPSEQCKSSSASSSGHLYGSQDLVLRHFQATDPKTVIIYIAALVERVNAHCEASSCCKWHATVRSIIADSQLLFEEHCRPSAWLPACGWQCCECLALNNVDEDDCEICGSDRVEGDMSPELVPPPGDHTLSMPTPVSASPPESGSLTYSVNGVTV